MIYQKQIFVPAGTTLANPIKTDIIIREMNIDQIEVKMDTVAAQGLLQVKMFFGTGSHWVYSWPEGGENWIIAQGSWNEHIKLPVANLPATIVCVSPNAVENHTVLITLHTS